jgi:hypothetical protein
VTDLPVDQMVHEGPGVLGEAGYEHADLQVGVRALPHSEIVRFCENVDSVWKCALKIRGNLIIKQCFGSALVSMQTGSNILPQCGSGSKLVLTLRVEAYNLFLFSFFLSFLPYKEK